MSNVMRNSVWFGLALITWVVTVVLFKSGYWMAAFAALAAFLLGSRMYRRRADRGAREPEPIRLRGGLLTWGVGLLVLGLLGIALLLRGVASGEVAQAIVVDGPFTVGCLLLAFRLLTYVRLQRALKNSLAASPILVGTGESFFGRLRAVGLEHDGLVTVEASAFAKPTTFHRIPELDISEVEEPELGSLRVVYGNGETFSVRHGSVSAARQLAQDLGRQYRRDALGIERGSVPPDVGAV